MPNMLFANNANTTLASSLSNSATSMSVTSATGFPSPTGVQYFYCTLADAATQTTIEIVKVTSVSGTTFAITRAQDGTTATAFAAGAVVSLRLVRASLNDFPKLDETNTFNADQAISGQLTSSAGLATTGTFTATAPSDGLVMDYATGFGRFSAFAGDGFQWYNAGIANTKLMQLSSSGVITTATWNGATVGVAYGGTGLTSLTANYIPYGNATNAFQSSSGLQYNGLTLGIGATPSTWATYNGIQLASSSFISFSGSGFGSLLYNAYYNGGYKYVATDYANQYYWQNGAHIWTNAPSGTAGNAVTFTEAMRIDSSGNLLVGTTSAQATGITVLTSSSTVNGVLYASNSHNASGDTCALFAMGSNTNDTSSKFLICTEPGVANKFFIYGNGTYATSSDRNLKKNIETTRSGYIDDLMKLRVVKYNWNADAENTPKELGLIAQELEQVFPGLVSESTAPESDTAYKQIKNGVLPFILIKALQELNEKFDAYVASHP
jgi:hypothetical protein